MKNKIEQMFTDILVDVCTFFANVEIFCIIVAIL